MLGNHNDILGVPHLKALHSTPLWSRTPSKECYSPIHTWSQFHEWTYSTQHKHNPTKMFQGGEEEKKFILFILLNILMQLSYPRGKSSCLNTIITI
jgi:hypothetical protein